MPQHPALAEGRAAVITGGASGIGLAAAKRFAALGMKICLADLSQEALDQAVEQLSGATIVTVPTDVSRWEDVQRLKDRAYAAFGEVAVLMNNAGVSAGGGPFDHYESWQRVLSVNLWGVINGVHAFTQAMIDQGTPAAIVNTGSKQGITCPPGNTAYNITKAGVKVLTEGLAHALRNIEGCQASAHLLVPGSTFTGMTARGRTENRSGTYQRDALVDGRACPARVVQFGAAAVERHSGQSDDIGLLRGDREHARTLARCGEDVVSAMDCTEDGEIKHPLADLPSTLVCLLNGYAVTAR
jgi:NAD(P)-dependent dehydrogenase (short-subunit alcohol dehydrogenase family)